MKAIELWGVWHQLKDGDRNGYWAHDRGYGDGHIMAFLTKEAAEEYAALRRDAWSFGTSEVRRYV